MDQAPKHVGKNCGEIGSTRSTSSIPNPPFIYVYNDFLLPQQIKLLCASQNRFLTLGSILEPGRTPKTDKAAILVDAVRMVNQLRSEAQKLKESNSSLQDKIKELKVRLFRFLAKDVPLY